MKRTLTFYTDPRHGWLKVSIADLERLGIDEKISQYSYMRGDYAYLEEDCDATLFYRTAGQAGWTIKTQRKNTNRQSKIRGYDSYFPQVYRDTEKVARELLDRHGFEKVEIEFSGRMKRTLGLACFRMGSPYKLKLSSYYVSNNSESDVLDTILHEIAHFIAGNKAGHNWQWKQACRQVGANPQRLADQGVVTEKAPWKLVCGCCDKKLGERHRRTNMDNRYCRSCGRSSKGKLFFTKNT